MARLRATGRQSIKNVNDVIVSDTAPGNPQRGTSWTDTSKTPPVTKVWDGKGWVDKLAEVETIVTEHTETFKEHYAKIISNESSIDLRVTQQEYSAYKTQVDATIRTLDSSLKTAESSISVLQGQIALKVEQTDIDTAISMVDGKFASYSTTNQMTAAITAARDNITSVVSQTYATKAEVGTVSGKVSSLETWKAEASQKITKDGIVATVGNYYAYESDLTAAENRIATAETAITQYADEISLRVKKDGVISSINQTAETIKIYASKLDLTGYVTISNLATSGATTIDGSNIKTGLISADRLDVDGLFAKDITATGSITGVNLIGARGTFKNIDIEDSIYLTNTESKQQRKVIELVSYSDVVTAINVGDPDRVSENFISFNGFEVQIPDGVLSAASANIDSLRANHATMYNTYFEDGVNIGQIGAYIYHQNNDGNIYFRYRPSASGAISYTNLNWIVTSINGKAASNHTHAYAASSHTHARLENQTKGVRLNESGNFYPQQGGTSVANACSLGSSATYWKDINYGGSLTKRSDRRDKIDLGSLTERESLLLLRGISMKKFSYILDENKFVHRGIYAQDLRDLLISTGIGHNAMITVGLNEDDGKDITDLTAPEDTVHYGVDYTQMIPDLVVGWQHHDKQLMTLASNHVSTQAWIAQIQAQISALQAQLQQLQASA